MKTPVKGSDLQRGVWVQVWQEGGSRLSIPKKVMEKRGLFVELRDSSLRGTGTGITKTYQVRSVAHVLTSESVGWVIWDTQVQAERVKFVNCKAAAQAHKLEQALADSKLQAALSQAAAEYDKGMAEVIKLGT